MKSIYLLLVASLFLFVSCEEIIDPVFDNPYDPESPNIGIPYAKLTETYDQQVIESSTITFTWEGEFTTSRYSYMLEGYDEDFCELTLEKTITYEKLDDDDYTFYVKEVYGNIEQDEATISSFEIDAVQNSAVLFKKWVSFVEPNIENYIDVCIENVQDLKGLSTKINIGDNVNITKVENNFSELEVSADNVSLFTNEIIEMNATNIIDLNLILLGTQGFSGNGSICRIYFKATENTTITFDNSNTVMRNTNNSDIDIELIRDAIINIK